MPSIFLCHSSRDKEFVRILKSRLSRYKINVWLDEDEIKAGESLIISISNAINRMDYLGIILSSNSIRSKWVQEELEIALNRQISESKIRVIPILFRKCTIPLFLKGKKYVSFTNWNKKADFDVLKPSVEELVKAMDIDPRDNERWSGKLMIKICDFRKRIASYFNPLTVEVHFFDDFSGIEYIKVDNGNSTFQLYGYWSYPSHIDLLNEIFNSPGEKPIIDVEIVDTIVWSVEERDQLVKSACAEFKVKKDDFWNYYTNQETMKNASNTVKKAIEKYEKWLEEQNPISLIRQGDFPSDK